jgi:AcrR family transcriptional regulator
VAFEPLTPDRRRAMTRQYLLEAAATVFAAHGFHGATLDQVAAAAGFTKGAVYSNFKNKDELFLALLDDRVDRQFAVVAEVIEREGDEPIDRIMQVRDLLRTRAFFWEESWTALYLEFVVYSLRNPDARAKLAASAHRSRAFVQELFGEDHPPARARPADISRDLAEISLALFAGLGIDRLIDPTLVTDTTIDLVLALLSDARLPGDTEPPSA